MQKFFGNEDEAFTDPKFFKNKKLKTHYNARMLSVAPKPEPNAIQVALEIVEEQVEVQNQQKPPGCCDKLFKCGNK